MKKTKEVKKKQKVEKEKDVIKKSDYENSNDNKKIIVVALILALLIGTFAYVRSLDEKKEEKEPVEDVVEQEKEEEQPVVEENTKVENNYQQVQTPAAPTAVVDIWEDLKNISTTLEAGTIVELPNIKTKDNETEITAVISYKYRVSSDEEYTAVDEFDTTKMGEYVITYTLSYQDGRVETKDVVVTVVDTSEPVVNNVKDGMYYNKDILLDITEYSPYIVELNGNVYDETVAITSEGEYTLVVTEDTELGSSITVTFTIDKTLPEINFVPNVDGTVNIEIIEDEESIESIVITKDGIEIDSTEVISEEGEYEVTVTDKAGNSSSEKYLIDITAPLVEVTYTPNNSELTDEKVIVVINANEEIKEVDGWTLSSDKLTLTKKFTKNTVEVLEIKDISGNTTEVKVVVDYIDYNIGYTPELTIENLIANQVKATITSLKKLIFADEIKDEWKETYDEELEIYTYEKIYTEAKEETLEYTYEGEDGQPVSGEITINIQDITIVDTFVIYDIDETTQNVKVLIVTDEEVLDIPEGWVLDDEYMSSTGYRYYKTYTENVEYEVVEFVTENHTYVASIVIDSIDRTSPVAEVTVDYEAEKTSATITVTANEEIKVVDGWVLGDDKKSISKKIDRPTEVTTDEIIDDVTIVDLKGNETEVEYSYNWNLESSTE